MSSILTYGEWLDICRRGTSGDQVYDILASWKDDWEKLEERYEERLHTQKLLIEDYVANERMANQHIAELERDRDNWKDKYIKLLQKWNHE